MALPKIGIIDFYGVRKANRERIDKALGVKIGDPLPKSKGEIELQLELVTGVIRASLEAVCCTAGQDFDALNSSSRMTAILLD